MAQHDYNIANQSFPSFRTDLNNALSAIQTNNSGTSRPSGAVAGQIWLDTTSATSPTLKYYDGTDDISLATIDHSANTVNWLDSTVSITGLATTATGTVLTLSDTANTTSQNLIIDNQKQIRFRETTANGTNYVALQAPASLASDVTFTLPSADGTANQVLQTNGSGVLSFATVGGLAWQSVQTTGFTAVAGRGYPCNTTSSAFTVTLPASATAGDTIQIVDYAGTFGTNNITLAPNGLKINGGTGNKGLTTNREAVTLTYVDSTQGWVASSGTNYGSQSIDTLPYSVDFLVIAGGGGGGRSNAGTAPGSGGGAGGYRSSNSTYGNSGGGASAESNITLTSGTVYTITVGAGGAGSGRNSGNNSSISGTGITTITSNGGGYGGGSDGSDYEGVSGGCGGGAYKSSSAPAGTANQGYAGGGATVSAQGGEGGGGTGSAGSSGTGTAGANGGNGVASTITGSSVTRGGGGGGAGDVATIGSGGTGGGGNGGGGVSDNIVATNGTANTGGGGGGSLRGSASPSGQKDGGNGGSGVVILRMATSNYTGTTTGSPTVTTSGSDTILTFTASGSYTA